MPKPGQPNAHWRIVLGIAALVMLTVLVLVGLSVRVPVTAASRQLTAADAGSTVTLAPNDFLTVTLDDNPTTGYSWALDQVDASVLAPQHDDFTQGSSNAPGSGGTRALSFKALRAGSTVLRLKRWRPSEGDTRFERAVRGNGAGAVRRGEGASRIQHSERTRGERLIRLSVRSKPMLQ